VDASTTAEYSPPLAWPPSLRPKDSPSEAENGVHPKSFWSWFVGLNRYQLRKKTRIAREQAERLPAKPHAPVC
jgi:hypothetical protein